MLEILILTVVYFDFHVGTGPPIVRSERTQYGQVKETVKIECVAFAVPRPSKIIWTHGGYEVEAGNSCGT